MKLYAVCKKKVSVKANQLYYKFSCLCSDSSKKYYTDIHLIMLE